MTLALSVLGLVLSVVAVVVSILFARKQVAIAEDQASLARRQAAIENAQPVAIDLFREFREGSAVRRLLHQELATYSAANGWESISDEALQQLARSTSHWYDNVGVMVAHDMVDAEVVAGFLGNSAAETWQLLERFIKQERARRLDGDYQDYFEYLVRVCLQGNGSPDRVRRRRMPELYELREQERSVSGTAL